jgi:myo-inositol 2-dehydrogenase / D-chiro-inositol 1-dehydrogenase
MLRVALLGAGRIGRVHAETIAAHPRAELAVIHDPVEAAASELASRFGTTTSGDVDSILADDRIGAVVIGTPTPTHVDLITAAVRAGKAVLCEKPIDLDLTRVDECWSQVKDAGVPIMVGFNRRFDPSFAAIRRRVAEGELGRLEQLLIVSRDPAPPPAAYLGASGGLYRDMMIHDLDLARFFLGDITQVQAMGASVVAPYIAEAGDVDSAMVLLQGTNGELCQITNSRRAAFGYDQRLEAFGEKGMLSAGNQTGTSVQFCGAAGTEQRDPYLNFFLDRYLPAYHAELDHFVTSVLAGTPPSPSFADGREALRLADAANESLRTGAAVKLS